MMWQRVGMAVVAAVVVAGAGAWAQSGVLIPLDKDQPDAKVLSLAEMSVNVVVDDGDARVYVTQIFANHTAKLEEGTYVFALPTGSTVSDFATWDGAVRIPAVILERKRAEEMYEEAKSQAIDPGLLEAGERDGSDAKQDSTFTAKITPIPAWGTKRLELEYHQKLTVDGFRQGFVFPLTPAQYAQQRAGTLKIHFELHSTTPLVDFGLKSKGYALAFSRNDAHAVVGEWMGSDVALDEDLALGWKLDAKAADQMEVTVFRNPRMTMPQADEVSPVKTAVQPGFFLAQTLVGMSSAQSAAVQQDAAGRDVVLLLDTSLSMQWDKLERSYGALEAVLRGLKPQDRFSLILFNQDVALFKPQAVAATPDAIEAALGFVKASRLRGGTDLGKALAAGLAQAQGPSASLYVFTDGGSDRGETVVDRRIAARYALEWKQSARPRTEVFAVGDDANLPLLRMLAGNDGLMENVLSSEPLEPKLTGFVEHTSTRPIAGVKFEVGPAEAAHTVYPLETGVYAGSMAAWVGDYLTPKKGVRLTATADRAGNPLKVSAQVDLPVEALEHPQLPRLWAQARVNALLAEIARDGETKAAVEEIIALSRKYKFVTPYTSFLAVPRSLLRPRVIRPGDPVLRVHTDPSITSVIALFPFGLTQPLRHLADEDVKTGGDADRLWETRFLAPADMQDGTYAVRLILRDGRGNTYSETKTFVIASTPPVVKVTLERMRFRRGDVMTVRAEATASTQTLVARLEGALPVDLRWSDGAKASVGEMRIPETLAAGEYTLSVTAEDVAHNVGSEEVRIEIVP
jgi:Ca-activated chloride channel family protein